MANETTPKQSVGSKVLGFFVEAGQAIVKGVSVVGSVASKVTSIFNAGVKLEPEAQKLIVTLVEDAETIVPPILAAVAARGISWTEDAAVVAGVEKLAQNFAAALPEAKQLITDFESAIDLKAQAAVATSRGPKKAAQSATAKRTVKPRTRKA